MKLTQLTFFHTSFLFQVKERMVRTQLAVRHSPSPFNSHSLDPPMSTGNLKETVSLTEGEAEARGKVVKRKWYKPSGYL